MRPTIVRVRDAVVVAFGVAQMIVFVLDPSRAVFVVCGAAMIVIPAVAREPRRPAAADPAVESLRERYATGVLTIDELETGLDRALGLDRSDA